MLDQGYFMVPSFFTLALGFCAIMGQRWSDVPAIVPGDEKRICERNIQICSHCAREALTASSLGRAWL